MSEESADVLDTAEAEFEAFRQQEYKKHQRLYDPWAQQSPEVRAEWVQGVLLRGKPDDT